MVIGFAETNIAGKQQPLMSADSDKILAIIAL
jgi:hypothetical protein